MKRTILLIIILVSFLYVNSFGQEFISVEQEPIPISNIQSLVQYPEEAKRIGLEGKVTVSALIDVDGKVLKVEVDKSTHKTFERSALKALLRTRFRPALQNGLPVKVWYTTTIVFSLSQHTVAVPVVRFAIDTNGVWEVAQAERKAAYERANPPKPKLISDIKSIVEYPDYLQKMNIYGKVRLTIDLDSIGNVTHHHIVYSDNPFLEEPVKNAMTKMKFEQPSAPSQYSYQISFEGDSVRIW